MSEKDRRRWDKKWQERHAGENPAEWLVRHRALLQGGMAADLACGRGGDALWLSRQGYGVLAVDGSMVALRQAQQRAARAGLQHVLFVQADLDHWRLPLQSVDLLTVFRFLDRNLFAMIRDAVRPGGLVVYTTRTVRWLEREPDASQEFLLQSGELHRRFLDWEILDYEEADVSEAIVARRPVLR
jgi:SAM-dependent methyltransferase